ncbi:hypothetical protein OH76DRAFT_1423748 [Lentinus brumalis]|uniref:Uncharacterized protein n=1 Tax=Lentinus brumalis TaxID=2498619 RepID=A0A371CJB8_9APHY|nr:hypothetical protein OH76DRAFT_1423748 [Polyporus brumalis]
MIVAIDLATLVAFLALALAVHIYVRLFGREYLHDQRRAGRVEDFSRARDPLPTVDPAKSDNALDGVLGGLGSHLQAHPGGSVARPTALPVTPPPTVLTHKETPAYQVPGASRPSMRIGFSTSAAAPLPRQQFLAAFPPSIPGSPPPSQRLRATLPRHVPSESAVKMEVDPPVSPTGESKGKGRTRAESPVPTKVSFTTHRVPISTMSTLASLPTVSRSTTPGSSMTLLVEDDEHMEVDQQVEQSFFKRIIKTRNLPLKPGQDVPTVLTFAYFCSVALNTIVQPPPDACLETPTVGDVFCHRVDEYTPPAYQLFLRVLHADGRPGWLEVDEGLRRDDGMYLIVTPSTEEVSWIGASHYRSHMRKYGKFRSPLRQVTPVSEVSSLSSISDA